MRKQNLNGHQYTNQPLNCLRNQLHKAPILHYPDPTKQYIVYTDASDDACGAQLSQEHDGTEFSIAFISHTFTDTQRKWSTTKQEGYRVYYAVTNWNYYLQGAEVIVHNDDKPLAKFLNGKKKTPITKWTDGDWNLQHITLPSNGYWEPKTKQLTIFSRLVELPHDRQATVQMLSSTYHDGLAFHTRSRTTQSNTIEDPAPQPKTDTVAPDITKLTDTPDATPKLLTEDKLQALLQIQRTDPFW